MIVIWRAGWVIARGILPERRFAPELFSRTQILMGAISRFGRTACPSSGFFQTRTDLQSRFCIKRHSWRQFRRSVFILKSLFIEKAILGLWCRRHYHIFTFNVKYYLKVAYQDDIKIHRPLGSPAWYVLYAFSITWRETQPYQFGSKRSYYYFNIIEYKKVALFKTAEPVFWKSEGPGRSSRA